METNGEYVWFVSDRFPIFNGVPKFYELGLTKDRLVHQQDELIEYVSRRYKTKPCTYAGLQFLQYYANMLANTGGAFQFDTDFLWLSERIRELMSRTR